MENSRDGQGDARVDLFFHDFIFSVHNKMGVKYLVPSRISRNGSIYSFPIFIYN
jgi:hypothetical protein